MHLTKQKNISDCGLIIIQSLHNEFFNRLVDLETLRQKSNITSKGLNINALISLASNYGLKLEGYNAQINDVLKYKKEWMIAMIKNKGNNHYIIFKIFNDYIQIIDPAKGKYKLLYKEFEKIYQNIVITITQTKYEKIKENNLNKNLFHNIYDVHTIIWICILILLSIIFMFTSSLFMKIIFDNVIPGLLKKLLNLLIIVFISISFLKIINSFLRKIFIKKLSMIIESKITFKYYDQITKSQLLEIYKIDEADLIKRITLIESTSSFIATSFFIIFEESIVLIISSIILMWISLKFFALALGLAFIMVLIAIIFHLIIKPLYPQTLQKGIKLFSKYYQHIRMIEDNKNPDKELSSFQNSKNSYYDFQKQNFSIWKILTSYDVLTNILSSIMPIIITYLFVQKIFVNKMSVGTMLLFLTIFNYFTSPVDLLTNYFLTFSQNKKNLNLIKKVLALPKEKRNNNGINVKKINNLELKNANFSYDRPIFNIKNLKINKNLHIIGNNGSGKTTLLKILSLKILPKFLLLINNIEYTFYNINKLREHIFWLDSKTFLPSQKIFNFLTNNNYEKIQNLKKNIKKYELDKFLVKNNIKIDEFIIDNGKNISAGQKQIILLLQIFTKRYDLIILDEALENVSNTNLNFLKKQILNYQKKSIFIEVSHTKKYLTKAKEVLIEKIT